METWIEMRVHEKMLSAMDFNFIVPITGVKALYDIIWNIEVNLALLRYD